MPEGGLLCRCTGVAGTAFGGEAALIADAKGVLVVMAGMSAGQILMSGLIDMAIASDVVVVTGEPEAGIMAGYEVLDRESAVTACGAAVNDDEVDGTHGRHFYPCPPVACAMAALSALMASCAFLVQPSTASLFSSAAEYSPVACASSLRLFTALPVSMG